MQAWPGAIHVTRGFQPIERRPHSLVADHMAMDLEARRIEGNEELAQMVLAEHHRRIAALSVMIILEHRGAAVLEHAIEKEFRRMHFQHGRSEIAAETFDA